MVTIPNVVECTREGKVEVDATLSARAKSSYGSFVALGSWFPCVLACNASACAMAVSGKRGQDWAVLL